MPKYTYTCTVWVCSAFLFKKKNFKWFSAVFSFQEDLRVMELILVLKEKAISRAGQLK